MYIKPLHCWDVDCAEAEKIQNELRQKLILEGAVKNVKLIAGADVSYSRQNDSFYAAVIVFSFPDLTEVEVATACGNATFPYVPGFLTFREAPVLLQAFQKIQKTPEVVIFDGQGSAHPRGMGLASHVGLFLDVATIGCAKSKLVGEWGPLEQPAGSYSPLIFRNTVVGVALRNRTGVKPVFVSPGHKISLNRAIELVQQTTREYRLPEPVRQAHLLANKLRQGREGDTELSLSPFSPSHPLSEIKI